MQSLPIASCEPAMLLADLANLPPKPPRSKLEPHRELIRELRRSGRTYREVARLFSDRLGFHVAPSTLHSFVKVRARHRKQVQFELPSLTQALAEAAPPSRVAALKAKQPASEAKRTRFVFRENEPLTLSSDGGAQ
jgi:hypothetical protein